MRDEVELEIIDTNREKINEFHRQGWGKRECTVTKEQVEELLKGKSIALFDGEYTTIITLKGFEIEPD